MNWIKSLFVSDKKFYKLVVTMAIPVVLQNMITIGLNIIDTFMLGSFGEIQIAGSSLANELINIFHILCMGMGGGAAVLTAQFWGRKDIVSLKKAVTIMMRICLCVAALFTLVTALFPSQIMSVYTTDADVIAKGRIYYVSFLKLILAAKSKFEKKEEEIVEEKTPEEPKETTEDILAEIRDLLKNKNN